MTKDSNENEIRECSSCSTEISEGEQFCSECGEAISEAAPVAPEEPVTPHCSFCGLNVNESTEVCPRCDATIAVAEAKDDDEDDDDEDDQDGDEEGEERKVLNDKAGAAKKEESAPEVVLSPIDEARLYVDLASQLDKRQLDELAAHIVWGTQQESVDTPRWLPTEYREDWAKMVNAGKPKTMLGAISYLGGVIGARTGGA